MRTYIRARWLPRSTSIKWAARAVQKMMIAIRDLNTPYSRWFSNSRRAPTKRRMIELQYDLAFFEELIEDQAMVDCNGNTDGYAQFTFWPFEDERCNWYLGFCLQSPSVYAPNQVDFKTDFLHSGRPELSMVELEQILHIMVGAFNPDVAYISSSEFDKAMRKQYDERHCGYGWLTYFREFDRWMPHPLPPPFLDEGKYLRLESGLIDPGIFERVPLDQLDIPKIVAQHCFDPKSAGVFWDEDAEAGSEESIVNIRRRTPEIGNQAPLAQGSRTSCGWNGLQMSLRGCPDGGAVSKTKIRLRGIMMKVFGLDVGDAELRMPPSALAPDEIALTKMVIEIEHAFQIPLSDFDLGRVKTGDDLAVVIQSLMEVGDVPIPELATEATEEQRATALANCRVALELLAMEPDKQQERLGAGSCVQCALVQQCGEWLRRCLQSPWLTESAAFSTGLAAVVRAIKNLSEAERRCDPERSAESLAQGGWTLVRSSACEALKSLEPLRVG